MNTIMHTMTSTPTLDDPFNNDNRDKIFFSVLEETLQTENYSSLGQRHIIEDKKVLYKNNLDSADNYIDVVNTKYRVVENKEVLLPLQEQMLNYFDDSVLQDIKVIDSISSDNRRCFSEYIFPQMKREIVTNNGHKTNILLRFIMKNSFDGKGSVTLFSGDIDAFCTNGQIVGQYDVTRKRHTRNFETEGFIEAFDNTLEKYEDNVKRYQKMADTRLFNWNTSDKVQKLFDALTNTDRAAIKRKNGLSDKLFAQWIDETVTRGNNLFAIHSALTHYSSHSDEERFAMRSNGDESTLYKRQESVGNWLASDHWKNFVNEAMEEA